MLIMTDEEIVAVLNEIAVNEFKRNYNKSESVRVLEECCGERDPLATELESKLSSRITPDSDIRVKVSNIGVYTVTVPSLDHPGCRVVAKQLYPSVKLPYAYVMGQKVGKRNMISFVEDYELHKKRL